MDDCSYSYQEHRDEIACALLDICWSWSDHLEQLSLDQISRKLGSLWAR